MINLLENRFVSATVLKVWWERIIVHIDVVVDVKNVKEAQSVVEPFCFYAVNGLYEAKAIFEIDSIENNIYHLSLNVTNPGDARCLPVGTYKIYVCQGENILACCVADPGITDKMENISRNFLYSNRKSVYAVTFMVQEGGEDLPFIMHTLSAKRTGIGFPSNNKKRISVHIPSFDEYKKKNSKKFLRKVYSMYRKKYQKHGKNKKVILFMTEQSDKLGANLVAVFNRMKERNLEEKFTLLTSARMASSQRQSQMSWLDLIKKLAMSDMVFVDDHAPVLDWLKLDSETEVVQLWHAGAGFKSSGYSRWGHIGCPAPSSAHRQYTYGIAGSKNIAHFFSEVWGINTENVLPTGMPRIDEYLNEQYRLDKTEELYKKYPLCKGRKVILFAPTYRGKNRKEAYYPYELIDFERLYDLCGDEYVVLFKMHPWVSTPVPIKQEYGDKFVDVGEHPNINDLFYITELLITDYSSNIFEFSLMKKPMLFFAFDKIQYSFSRGFHRDYESSAPGKVCFTFDELLTAIKNKDFEYEKVEQYVKHHFDYVDTHSSDRVIDWIVLGNIPEDIQKSINRRAEEQEKIKTADFSVLDESLNEINENEESNSEEVTGIFEEENE